MVDWLVDAIDPSFERRVPRLEVEAKPGSGLVLHPGAGSPAKRWPPERFATLANALKLPLAVVQGPADPAFELDGEYELWHDRRLAELACRLKGSWLFVGNDSGISHLAAAVGTPTLAVYITTDPAVWGVRGPHARRLQEDLSVEH